MRASAPDGLHPYASGLRSAAWILWIGVSLLALAAARAQDFSHGEKVDGPQAPAIVAANDALAANDWVKAVELLKPLADADPKNAQLLYDLGSAEDALDREGPAEESYRAAILDAGGYLEPRLALGLLLARQGKMDDARAELKAAASIENGDKLLRARALRALARIDEKARPADARDELLGALAISPETPEDTIMTAELAESAGGGKEAAESAYKRLLIERPGDPDATSSYAHLLMQQKRSDEAEKLLTTGLATHPGDAGMSIQLAEVYVAEGKAALALPLVETLHTANPNDAAVSRLLAELYVDAKDYAKAEPLLAALAAQNPREGALVDLDAEALLHQHQPVAAQRLLTRVVAQPELFSTPEDWGLAASDLAIAASENNEPDLVLQILQNRAKVLPPTAPILFLSAIAEDKLHHVKNAIEAYRKFLVASNGANPNEEFEARHRLVALDHEK
jgi:tetratricopeptide (TPR) repeat protein